MFHYKRSRHDGKKQAEQEHVKACFDGLPTWLLDGYYMPGLLGNKQVISRKVNPKSLLPWSDHAALQICDMSIHVQMSKWDYSPLTSLLVKLFDIWLPTLGNALSIGLTLGQLPPLTSIQSDNAVLNISNWMIELTMRTQAWHVATGEGYFCSLLWLTHMTTDPWM